MEIIVIVFGLFFLFLVGSAYLILNHQRAVKTIQTPDSDLTPDLIPDFTPDSTPDSTPELTPSDSTPNSTPDSTPKPLLNVDCQYSNWSSWTPDCPCGVSGRQQRTRSILAQARGSGQPCQNTSLIEEKDCKIVACPSDLDCNYTWDKCTSNGDPTLPEVLCGGGWQKIKILTQSSGNGKKCPSSGTLQQCNTKECTKDCIYNYDTPCSKKCGGGVQQINIISPALFGGKPCGDFDPVTNTYAQTKKCHTCSPRTDICNEDKCPPINCVMSNWSQCHGAECGVPLGGGSVGLQTRTIVTFPEWGGTACGSLSRPCASWGPACTDSNPDSPKCFQQNACWPEQGIYYIINVNTGLKLHDGSCCDGTYFKFCRDNYDVDPYSCIKSATTGRCLLNSLFAGTITFTRDYCSINNTDALWNYDRKTKYLQSYSHAQYLSGASGSSNCCERNGSYCSRSCHTLNLSIKTVPDSTCVWRFDYVNPQPETLF